MHFRLPFLAKSTKGMLQDSWGSSAARWLGVCLICILVVSGARADGVTFLDSLGQTPSVSTSSSRISGSCTSATFTETCNVIILAPPNVTDLVTASAIDLLVADSPNGVISDEFGLVFCASNVCGQTQLKVTFVSSDDSVNGLLGGGQTCQGLSNPCIVENGAVQQAFTVTWSDGTVDTVSFQSGLGTTPTVPEPGTLALFGSGLISILGFMRRKILV